VVTHDFGMSVDTHGNLAVVQEDASFVDGGGINDTHELTNLSKGVWTSVSVDVELTGMQRVAFTIQGTHRAPFHWSLAT
jgi:hypothetical protein